VETVTNREIAKRFISAWNAGGQEVVDELAAPELEVWYEHWEGPALGPEQFREMLADTFSYFPDMRIAVEELLTEGEKVMVRWRYTATHQRGELFGVQPAGTEVSVAGVTVYRIVDGKVVEERGLVDNFALAMQLGARIGSGS
jgi:steroid delta-isomerase-like uncharacterized protein